MPNSGHCEFVYICAGLYAIHGRSDRQFSIVIRIRPAPIDAEYLLLSSMRTARLGGIQITLFCRVTQPASHRVAGDRMRDVDDRDDGVGALAL
jgi:hypothetical protein